MVKADIKLPLYNKIELNCDLIQMTLYIFTTLVYCSRLRSRWLRYYKYFIISLFVYFFNIHGNFIIFLSCSNKSEPSVKPLLYFRVAKLNAAFRLAERRNKINIINPPREIFAGFLISFFTTTSRCSYKIFLPKIIFCRNLGRLFSTTFLMFPPQKVHECLFLVV